MEKTNRILVVEDERAADGGCRGLLSREGFAATASTGDRMLRDLDLADFAVILVDLDAAGRDGGLLLDEIQDRCPGVEVIGIRGDQSLEDALAAVKSGVSELLARPLSPVAVRSAVLQALERREWLIRADRPPARGDGAEPCWLEYEGDGQVAVGAERAFVEAIGDPVYVELPVDGQRIARGGTLLRVLTRDSRIHVVDCPVTGVVLRCNEALVRDADEIRQGVWAVRLSVERQGRLRQSGGAV